MNGEDSSVNLISRSVAGDTLTKHIVPGLWATPPVPAIRNVMPFWRKKAG